MLNVKHKTFCGNEKSILLHCPNTLYMTPKMAINGYCLSGEHVAHMPLVEFLTCALAFAVLWLEDTFCFILLAILVNCFIMSYLCILYKSVFYLYITNLCKGIYLNILHCSSQIKTVNAC